MMALNMHKQKEAIEEIVETAMQELKVEKKLKEIEGVWSTIKIEYAPHKDTEMLIPKPSKEVVESIESQQIELQGIFGIGEFMEHLRNVSFTDSRVFVPLMIHFACGCLSQSLELALNPFSWHQLTFCLDYPKTQNDLKALL